MTFNTTNYYYNRSFDVADTYAYNISCDASGYEQKNYSSSLWVKPNSTLFAIDGRQSIEGTYKYPSSIVFSKFANTNYDDMILMGSKENNNGFIFYYTNNHSLYSTASFIDINLSVGSISLLDYDVDNDTDVFISAKHSGEVIEEKKFITIRVD